MQRSARHLLLRSISSYPFRSSRPPKPHSLLGTLIDLPLKPHLFASRNPTIHFGRRFGTGDPAADHGKEVDEINLKFAEAREEIEAALESKDTVYFDEEAQCARDAVREVLGLFEGLLARLPERERAALQRSMGLKIEQLKAELKQLDE
ncbi:uncharacterized protein LOC109716358 [Ananas comosus]|uniref:Uncharacterized protein LOC109716358 n=1 Tax=Ananas comosus TaxID=4615 RepID=A0A199UDU6_ANACO|nr:uncharacterized protein LOC109716358 [Ananas comosus]OAY63032.1 hypothetical protein ACMD2_13399 [Ananas comosus]